MTTYIVIPNWNGIDMLAACLTSLQKQTYPTKIIVVDNASIDGSTTLIKDSFPEVILLENPVNMGFAGGVNTGIQYALDNGADAVALFNNDAVAENTWLEELVKEMEQYPVAGIVTGRLMQSNKTHFDSTGDYYTTWGIPFPRGRNQIAEGKHLISEEVFSASGGASLYRAETLKQIGLFDQRFFAYYEDVDISYRTHLAGWSVRYTPSAIAYHHIGGTSSKMGDFTRYHSVKNFLILYTKDMPTRLYWKYLPTFLYQFARTTARSVIDRKPHVWFKSVASFLIYLPSILKDRRKIHGTSTLSARQVEKLLYIGRAPKIPTLGDQ